MAFEVKMPQLGLTMEEGTVTKWVKQEGDTVKAGDVILEITTDKLTSEVESAGRRGHSRKRSAGIYRRSRRTGWGCTCGKGRSACG